jgi:hypothetical protein
VFELVAEDHSLCANSSLKPALEGSGEDLPALSMAGFDWIFQASSPAVVPWFAMGICLAIAELQAALPSAPKSVSSTSLVFSGPVWDDGLSEIEGVGETPSRTVGFGRPRRSGGTVSSAAFTG